jgi:hypothetical protein
MAGEKLSRDRSRLDRLLDEAGHGVAGLRAFADPVLGAVELDGEISSMHLPSRGLRPSATTIRNTGVFFVPMRFMRIFTDINLSKEHGDYRRNGGFASLVL